ncbi:tRNA (mnm(5)s(2)U34)-methyltransferase [Anaeromicrobium sediminis]|uniref:SAM-dependent methyltransferase n=1 Tax=Anaeromicrobium sediminis TaxID=1478221 RepID=A0A267MQK0_9FIRM|nr:class I SAM-dependent methyltransferase [Anaeromicrobium sediminis]PAB61178.1 SAM-dependent methyltransferase [Anaeromicrobium sediminis]
MENRSLTKITNIAWSMIENCLHQGSVALDGTMGNGNDTVFLREKIGNAGKIYSFDIQDLAVENTRKKLDERNMLSNVELIKDGHENLDKYIKEEIDGAMYNLGFLPKGDKSITTLGKNTVIAFEKTLNLLKKGGLMVISIYYGHEKGLEEKNMVLDYVQNLDSKKYHVIKMEFFNQKNNPPILVAIEKK